VNHSQNHTIMEEIKKIRKWQVHTTTYLITDEEILSGLLTQIATMEKAGKAYATGDLWQKVFSTFPRQSWGVKVGNNVMIFTDGQWVKTEVNEDNLSQIKILCKIGIVTHEIEKISHGPGTG